MSGKVEKVSLEEFQKEAEKPRRGRQSKWSATIEAVLKDKQPRKVSEITRGSVAAGVRAAKEAGLRHVASYPKDKTSTDGYIIIAPPVEEAKEAPKKKNEKKAS